MKPNPTIAAHVGDVASWLYSQVEFWSSAKHPGDRVVDGYVCLPYKKWLSQLAGHRKSVKTIARAFDRLRDAGYLIEAQNVRGRTPGYRLPTGQDVHTKADTMSTHEQTNCPLEVDTMSTPNGHDVHLHNINEVREEENKREPPLTPPPGKPKPTPGSRAVIKAVDLPPLAELELLIPDGWASAWQRFKTTTLPHANKSGVIAESRVAECLNRLIWGQSDYKLTDAAMAYGLNECVSRKKPGEGYALACARGYSESDDRHSDYTRTSYTPAGPPVDFDNPSIVWDRPSKAVRGE